MRCEDDFVKVLSKATIRYLTFFCILLYFKY